MTCDLFWADSSGYQSKWGTSPATFGRLFPLGSWHQKRIVRWKDCKSDRRLIAPLRSVDFYFTVNHGSIPQDHQNAVCYLLFAENSCFLVVREKKNPCALLVEFFFFPQSRDASLEWVNEGDTGWAPVWKCHYQRISFTNISKVSQSKTRLPHEVTCNLIQPGKHCPNSSRCCKFHTAAHREREDFKVENTRNVSLFPYCSLSLHSLSTFKSLIITSKDNQSKTPWGFTKNSLYNFVSCVISLRYI